MKKIFTILFAAGLGLSAAAQPAYAFNKNNHDNPYAAAARLRETDNSRMSDFSVTGYKEKQRQLREINWKFDQQIAMVKSNRRMGWKEKSMQIEMLEDHRSNEIRRVEYAYEKNNHGFMNDGRGWTNTHTR